MKHEPDIQNKLADALSKCSTLLVTMSQEVTNFEVVCELYKDDEDFGGIWGKLPFEDFYK